MELLERISLRSPLLRKGLSSFKQGPRAARRLMARGRPPYALLANSVPKSGTHLLVQILGALPGITNYDTFIVSLPALSYRPRDPRRVCRAIGRIVPGELVSGHLFFAEEYLRALSARGVVPFFIYRDPRDVAVSEAFYLTYMTRWHRAHRHYAGLRGDDERILASIAGIPREAIGVPYGDIRERYAPFLPWRTRPEVCAVRYEDLIGPEADRTMRQMLRFFAARTALDLDPTDQLRRLRAGIDPRRSRTFRAGGAGGWRRHFGERHKDLFKAVAGDLLIDLGYERDKEW